MVITVKGGKMCDEEKRCYADYIREKHPDKIIHNLEITIVGDEVELRFKYDNVPFERIRRITGYLVGTLDRWNNGKRAEEMERVKHYMEEFCNGKAEN